MERVLFISVLIHRVLVLNPGVMITRYYANALLGRAVIKSHEINSGIEKIGSTF